MTTRLRALTRKAAELMGRRGAGRASPGDREVVFAFRLGSTAPRNRSSQGTATEGLFHPDRRSPSGGQDQVARKGPSATPTDPGTGRFEPPGPVDPCRPAFARRGPWDLLSPASRNDPPAGPARPRSVPSPSPAWAGTKSPPRDGDGSDCAGGLNAGASVTLLFLQGVDVAGVFLAAGGDRRGSLPRAGTCPRGVSPSPGAALADGDTPQGHVPGPRSPHRPSSSDLFRGPLLQPRRRTIDGAARSRPPPTDKPADRGGPRNKSEDDG